MKKIKIIDSTVDYTMAAGSKGQFEETISK